MNINYANVCLKANVKFGDMNSSIDKTLVFSIKKKVTKYFRKICKDLK